MIVSAVIDPSAFGPLSIVDELAKREAIAFFQGIVQNGVVIDLPRKELLRRAMEEASKLGTGIGERIVGLLTELRNQHKKFVVCCTTDESPLAEPQNASATCCSLAASMQVDAILTTATGREQMEATNATAEFVLITEVSESRYEALRRRMLRVEVPLDQLPADEVEERLGRALKHAPTLELFDYRMVASPSRVRKFRDGIVYLIRIWERWCVVGDPSSRSVELYTVGNCHTGHGFVSCADAESRMAGQIVTAIRAAVAAAVRYHIKDDSIKVFHARGIVARHRAFTIDPGLDAFGANGPVRRCLFNADPAAEKYFDQCRDLPDCSLPVHDPSAEVPG